MGEQPDIQLPLSVRRILNLLQDAGFEACVVGGSVRDFLRGVQPHDWDICTSAPVEEIKKLFKKKGYGIAPTGLNFGTVMVVDDKQPFEISVFRGEQSSLEVDLMLRDFTVNAVAYSPDAGFIDPCGGRDDLLSGVLRCPGSARDRLREDPLRILRALRFAATLQLKIDSDLAVAMHKLKDRLKPVAVERITAELYKLFEAPGTRVAPLLEEFADVFFVLMPELEPMSGFDQQNPHHIYDVWKHSLKALEACAGGDRVLQLAVLFHDAGKPQVFTRDENGVGHFYGHAEKSFEVTQVVMNRLRFDSDTAQQVLALVKYHDAVLHPQTKCMRRWVNRLGLEQLRRLFDVKRCDAAGQTPDDLSEKLKYVDGLEQCLNRLLEAEAHPCFSLRDLAVKGADLMAIGYSSGPQLGDCLNRLLGEVLDERLPNERGVLLEQAAVWLA